MENNLSFPFSPSLSLNTNNIFATENTVNSNVRLGYYSNFNLMKTSPEGNNGNGFLGLMSEMDRKLGQGNSIINNNTSNVASVSKNIALENDQNKLGSDDNNNNNNSDNNNNNNNKKIKGEKKAKKPKYAFQTRSQVDILDDGYRWRKYGQKAVKNNKFPRSYYRCTHQGCNVKKQVQRLTKDEGIVVTTYEGIHSHSIDKSTDNFEHILTQMQIYSAY